jgi:hypothetical protein
MAWGLVGEEHCRFTAYHREDRGWTGPRPGCPDLRLVMSWLGGTAAPEPSGRCAVRTPARTR